MRWRRMFTPVLRDNPTDAELPFHKMLICRGFIRQLAAGDYTLLPLGQRTNEAW
jgi:prolyl-tRNA synthetase